MADDNCPHCGMVYDSHEQVEDGMTVPVAGAENVCVSDGVLYVHD